MPLQLKSYDLANILAQLVSKDLVSGNSTIQFCLSPGFSGGWEAWLQVEYAKDVSGKLTAPAQSAREVNYPGSAQRCDLFFQGARGAPYYVELKVQREPADHTALKRYGDDIEKLRAQGTVFTFNGLRIALVLYIQSAYYRDYYQKAYSIQGSRAWMRRSDTGTWVELQGTQIYATETDNHLILMYYSLDS